MKRLVFSLRALVLFSCSLGVVAGFYLRMPNSAQQLRSHGFLVFDSKAYKIEGKTTYINPEDGTAQGKKPKIDNDEVTRIHFPSRVITNEELAILRDLRNIEHVYAGGRCVLPSDFCASMLELNRLKEIDVSYSNFTDEDLMALAPAQSVREVVARHTNVTPSGVARFKQLRPDVFVIFGDRS